MSPLRAFRAWPTARPRAYVVAATALALASVAGCDTTIERTGLRSVCEIQLEQRTCVYGDLPLVDGDGGVGTGRTDCRLFDSEKEIERSQYQVRPGPSELCDGAMWHVELDVAVDIAPGNVFLVCRNDEDRRCPAPRSGGSLRVCRPGPVSIVARPEEGRGQFLVALVGDETGGLLVWGRGEAGASREAHGAWLDANGAPILTDLPVDEALVGGLPGATMNEGFVSVPISGGDSPRGLASVDVATLASLGPLTATGEVKPLVTALPFGELDGTQSLDAEDARALAPGNVRLAATGDGRLGATWVQGLVALGSRNDEVYRTFGTGGPASRVEPRALGSVRPDVESGPVVAHDDDGWGIAFRASYRVGATGTAFARLAADGSVSRAPRLASGLAASAQLALAPGRDGSFVAAGLSDTGEIRVALFPRAEEDVMRPIRVDPVIVGDASYTPRSIALAPLGTSGDVLLAAVAYTSTAPPRIEHHLFLARVSPRTETAMALGSALVPLDTRTSFNAQVCAAPDGSGARVTWALDQGSGATVSSLLVTPRSITEIDRGPIEMIDAPPLRVRSLACDGTDGASVAIWLTPQKWQAAWFGPMGPTGLEQGGVVTDDEHLSVAMIPGTRAAFVGRGGRTYWRIEDGRTELTLPIDDPAIVTSLGSVALGTRVRPTGDVEIIAATDALGTAGGSDRDVLAITGRVAGVSFEDAGEPVLISRHRALPLLSPRVSVEPTSNEDEDRFVYLATLDVPGGSAIVVDRDVASADGASSASTSTFTLGSGTVGARVAASIPERDGIRILVDDPETAIVTTLRSGASAPERTRPLWNDVSLEQSDCPEGRPFGLAMTRVDGIELTAFAVLCTSGVNPVRVYVATADDRGVPLAAIDPRVPLVAGSRTVADVDRAPPALAARVGDGMVVAFQNDLRDVVLRRFACEEDR